MITSVRWQQATWIAHVVNGIVHLGLVMLDPHWAWWVLLLETALLAMDVIEAPRMLSKKLEIEATS